VVIREVPKVVNVVCEERWDFHFRPSKEFLGCKALRCTRMREHRIEEKGLEAGTFQDEKETTPRWHYRE
jgi:hypothetical protein